MQKQNITILVLPVGGLGTRLRPLTLHTPKALVSVAGKPLLDYVLEEASASGIRDVALVANPSQRDVFRTYVRSRKKLFPGINVHIRFQRHPLGDGHAVLQAADIVGKFPFAVRFCDDIIFGDVPQLLPLIQTAHRLKGSAILLQRVPLRMAPKYGMVDSLPLAEKGVHRIKKIVEKPKQKDAPSNLAVVGGYVLMPSVMRNLKNMGRALRHHDIDALRLSTVFQKELADNRKVYGIELTGKRLDCGTLDGIAYAEKYIRKTKKVRKS
jgi:UTP--glucose-1-phosphate uridylyltransferase